MLPLVARRVYHRPIAQRASEPRPGDLGLRSLSAGAAMIVSCRTQRAERREWIRRGRFVPAELGLRHQNDVEVKWGIHPDGEKRPQPWASGHGTTISVLIHGTLRVTFHVDPTPQTVTLQKEGDYIIFGPDTVHSWEAIGHTVVLSLRFPSVEVWRAARPADP